MKETSAPSTDIDRILKYTITNYTTNYPRELRDFAPKDSFSRTAVESYYFIDTTTQEQAVVTNRKSKIAKNKPNTYRYWFDRSMARFALSDIKDKQEFATLFNSIAAENPDRKKRVIDDDKKQNNTSSPAKDNSVVITKSKEKIKSLNINSMILIEPEYYKFDDRKKQSTNIIENEIFEFRLREMIAKSASEADFNLTILAGNNFEEKEVQKFTDYGLLKDWMSEFFIDKKRTAIPVDYTRLKEVINRYDSRYAALMVNYSYISADALGTRLLYLFGSLIFYPVLPLAIYNMFPDKCYRMIVAVVDLEESKIVYSNIITFNTSDSNDLIKSQVYGMFSTLKGKKKVKKGEAS